MYNTYNYTQSFVESESKKVNALPSDIILPTRDIFKGLIENLDQIEFYDLNIDALVNQMFSAVSCREEDYGEIPRDLYRQSMRLLNLPFLDKEYCEFISLHFFQTGVKLFKLFQNYHLYRARLLPYVIEQWVGLDLRLRLLKNHEVEYMPW